ncbi:DNA replication/repair protein RecF [Blastococcus sp. Marseille-P5729]|uniref:DNA replication/repair protein RecF n=1 Tax=Blastococcus sp. Marseille-P5729 TaxID=2086582 RepID=UPI000D0FF377|nr:DNA replication/repair protein RecF [Blastococcus sp. Marseille-P5729]
MRIDRLQVIDFRNYVEAELELAPGPNLLVGANGQGKTNLVEAIGYLGTFASHRVSSDLPLIRRTAERAVVRAMCTNEDRGLLIELEITAGKANRARLNRAPVKRNRDLIGIVRSVLFAPEDLALVKGDPGDRRRFLDDLLILRYPRYAATKADFERVLKQRNALLKTAGMARRAGRDGDLRTLDVWDAHLVEHGAELVHGRLQLIGDLRPHFEAAYAGVSGAADTVGMHYRTSLADEPRQEIRDVPELDALREMMTARLAEVRSHEIDRALPLVGPQRDELVLELDEFPAKGYASHGQSWSIALALRLASYELLRAEGAEPILMLDDVFAELDAKRRAHLADLAQRAEQTIITAAVRDDVPPALLARTFEIREGTVELC